MVWVVGSGAWAFWGYSTADYGHESQEGYDCASFTAEGHCVPRYIVTDPDGLRRYQLGLVALVVAPPLAVPLVLLGLGLASTWIVKGFRS